jgi:aerobic carbon-monoxide dehydrogenase small subunit
MRIAFQLNGHSATPEIVPGETLMEVLRRTGTTSVKDGCSRGDCGSCAVLLDGRAVTACMLFAAQVDGHEVTTAEGLADGEGLHPLQRALLDAGGVQCGFCTPGVLMAALDLLARDPDPSDAAVRLAIEGNLCRCTGYVKIVDGVRDAAAVLRESDQPEPQDAQPEPQDAQPEPQDAQPEPQDAAEASAPRPGAPR